MGAYLKRRYIAALVARREPNVPMPEGFEFNNGGVRCDMLRGPCACGAWHSIDDWPFGLRVVTRLKLKAHRYNANP